jgi:hypothetical protein
MAFDYELKLDRASKHLQDLDVAIVTWLGGDNYTVRYEFDLEAQWPNIPAITNERVGRYMLGGSVFIPGHGPGTAPDGVQYGQGFVTAYATATKQPSRDPISLLIGDALHNMRSALDTLAFSLAVSFTKPMTQEVSGTSEFPIFGDEDRSGATGVGSGHFHQRRRTGDPAPGSGLAKTQGWDPRAQAVVEGFQPYHRGVDFRRDPLWVLHDLDRASKHRLLHTTVAAHEGMLWGIAEFRNVRCLGPGMIESYGGPVETDTPIGRIIGIHPIDADTQMHVEINPAPSIAFSDEAPAGAEEPVLAILQGIRTYIDTDVLPLLVGFL